MKSLAISWRGKNNRGTGWLPIPRSVDHLERFGLLGGLRHRENRNKGPAFKAFVELHIAFDGCKDRVIRAHADAVARPHLGAALTKDDVARNDNFAAILLDAQTASGAVPALPARKKTILSKSFMQGELPSLVRVASRILRFIQYGKI